MWYMILPIPYGFWFTVSHMGIFYLLHRKYPPKSKEESQQELAASDAGGSTDETQQSSNPLKGAGDNETTPESGMLTPGRF